MKTLPNACLTKGLRSTGITPLHSYYAFADAILNCRYGFRQTMPSAHPARSHACIRPPTFQLCYPYITT